MKGIHKVDIFFRNKEFYLYALGGMILLDTLATFQFLFVIGKVEPTMYIVPSAAGLITGAVMFIWSDKIRRTRKELTNEKNRLEFVLKGTGHGLWEWNPQTNDVVFDEQWCRLLGYPLEEIEQVFESWESRVHPEDLQKCYQNIEDHIRGETEFYHNIHRMKHRDGRWVYILDRGKIMERDENGAPIRFTGTHTDITYFKEIEKQLERSNRKLTELANRDGLTGLYNRRSMESHMERLLASWERNRVPFSLVMIDIDHFKELNDRYGHLTGDQCLQEVAAQIENAAKRPNDMAVRYGGEEFFLLLSGTDELASLKVAEALRQSIEHMGRCKNLVQPVTVSLGISNSAHLAVCTDFDDEGEQKRLIQAADKALYQAKNSGRNRTVIFHCDERIDG